MDIRIVKSLNVKTVFVIEYNYKRKVGEWPANVPDEEIIRQVNMKEAKEGLA